MGQPSHGGGAVRPQDLLLQRDPDRHSLAAHSGGGHWGDADRGRVQHLAGVDGGAAAAGAGAALRMTAHGRPSVGFWWRLEMLTVQGLKKTYKKQAVEVKVLQGLDLDVQRGEFLAV